MLGSFAGSWSKTKLISDKDGKFKSDLPEEAAIRGFCNWFSDARGNAQHMFKFQVLMCSWPINKMSEYWTLKTRKARHCDDPFVWPSRDSKVYKAQAALLQNIHNIAKSSRSKYWNHDARKIKFDLFVGRWYGEQCDIRPNYMEILNTFPMRTNSYWNYTTS